MRKPEPYRTTGGEPRWKVRYRSAGVETSQTFRNPTHANTFAALLSSAPGQEGVTTALAWLAGLEDAATAATFGQWFDTYLHQLTGITPRTRADYRAQHRRYLTDLDPMPLALISRSHVTGIVNRLESEGKSPKTIKNAIHMLSSVMALAIDEGHIARNPCRRVRLPRGRPKDETQFLTEAEFMAILEATPEHYRPLILALGGTGMRWSEATALQGQHIKGNVATVAHSWKRIPGGWELGAPKSQKSARTIVLPDEVLDVLPAAGRGEFLFRTPTGRPVRHANFYNRIWRPACAAAGIDPAPGIHALRHSHVGWLIARGVPLPVIQARLGHEKITTTIDTYGHLTPDQHQAAARAANSVFGNLRAIEG